ncbi:peptidoglycan-binding domain-containing protein [Streptomyces sp. G-G2]|uniref:peptidoglycan-binding domain-containing protein n=1 Tax=Streptomyces sp. G-G2 TaxID=3046201 RepID=UPI0024B9B496|nr:peptidoglycan-binding domain-containing protein [Streptomyces sp. G-G2]MDJ0383115.1 peptidoglycan-binding domain-containing protein [Streptomyces sp. G-G2]
MPHHPDETGPVLDDRLLVRPYVTRGGRPSRRGAQGPTGAPAWPPYTPGEPRRASAAVPAAASDAPAAPGAAATDAVPGVRREHGMRNSLVVLGLLAVLTTGTLLVLLDAPPADPPRTVRPPSVSVPGLPGHGAAAEDPVVSSTASVRPPATPAPSAPGASVPVSPAPARPTPSGPPVTPRPPSPATGATLRPGDSGAEVRALQEQLFAQGFTYVSASGTYDDGTRRGVAQFQRDRGLTGDPSGVYGPATRAAMTGRS